MSLHRLTPEERVTIICALAVYALETIDPGPALAALDKISPGPRVPWSELVGAMRSKCNGMELEALLEGE